MSRKFVYELIDKERRYQQIKWGELHDDDHRIADYLVILKVLLDDANLAIGRGTDDQAALAAIRKIAAVSVACMERFDAPSREL